MNVIWHSRFYHLHWVRMVKSRRMRWARHVARMGEGRGVHKALVGKPYGKSSNRPVTQCNIP
jgi:hypothetical protein